MLHQIKAHQSYTDLDLYQQCLVLQKIVEFKDFSRLLSDFMIFQYFFKADLIFKDFSKKPSNSSTFHACANSVNCRSRSTGLRICLKSTLRTRSDHTHLY